MANTILGEKRDGDVRIRSQNGIAVIEETYMFLVKSDDINNSRFNVVTTPGLPIVGVTVSSYGLTVCRSKNAVRDERNPLYWNVTCEFSSEVSESQDSYDPNTDPQAWIPIYETKFERLQEVVTRDLATPPKPVANSAGQVFSVGLTIGRFIPIWEFFQFESATVSDEDVIERNETVNENVFRGREPETLLLTIITSQIGYFYGQRRRFTQYSIKYNERKWKHRRLDTGTMWKNDEDKWVPWLDDGNEDDGQKELHLGPLDGNGKKADPIKIDAQGNITGGPAILEFDMYRKMDFSNFLRT